MPSGVVGDQGQCDRPPPDVDVGVVIGLLGQPPTATTKSRAAGKLGTRSPS